MVSIPSYNSLLDLALRDDWDWKQFDFGSFVVADGETKIMIDSKKDIPFNYRQGFLHSLDIQCDGNGLGLEAKLSSGPARGPITISGTLLEFELAGFDKNLVMSGDPVVFDRTAEAIPVPEYVAKLNPTWMYPFRQGFTWKLINKSGADIQVYGHQIYFILFQEKMD